MARSPARKCEVYLGHGRLRGDRAAHRAHNRGIRQRARIVFPMSGSTLTAFIPTMCRQGAFRGFGVPQVIWAYDSQMDIIARAIGADPLEFRLKPALERR